jgi:hypothetical protein
MQTKLTLSIEKTVINRAKIYAHNRNKSLSRIIEDYLKSISINNDSNEITSQSIPPITKSLAGILRGKKEIDFHSSIAEFLDKKHK